MLTGAFMASRRGSRYEGVPLGVLPTCRRYYASTCLLLSICMLVVTWSTYRLAGRRRWDAAMVALSPLLIVHAFTNWDLFAVALAGAGLVAWPAAGPCWPGCCSGSARRRSSTRSALHPAAGCCACGPGSCRRLAGAVLAAVVAWLVVNVPVALLRAGLLDAVPQAQPERPADFDSLWYIAAHAPAAAATSRAPKVRRRSVLNAVSRSRWLALVAARAGWLPRRAAAAAQLRSCWWPRSC